MIRILAALGLGAAFLLQEGAPAAEYSVSVTTAKGMILSGAAAPGTVRITSDLGTNELDLSKVRRIEFNQPRDTVELANSMLTGKVELAEFTLRSEYGSFRFNRGRITKLEIRGLWKGEKAGAANPAGPDKPAPSNRLTAAAAVPLAERARELFLVPDESAVLVHDDAAQKLLRFKAETLKPDGGAIDVWQGFRGLRAGTVRGYIYGFGSVDGNVSGGRLVALEDQGRKAAWHLPLDFEPVDAVSSPKGRLYLYGRNPEPLVAVVDPVARKVVSRWGGMPAGNRILVGADGKRLYIISDEGPSGAVHSVWLTGPEYTKPLAPTSNRMPLGARVGTPALMTGDGRFLVSGTSVMRVAAGPGDDLVIVGRVDPADCFAEAPARPVMIAATTGAAVTILSLPDFTVRKSYAPEYRLGEMRMDRGGRLFALTRPKAAPGLESRPLPVQLLRFDLSAEIAASAAPGAPSKEPEAQEPEIPRVALKDATGGAPAAPEVDPAPWKPESKAAQPCPACQGKGQVRIDRPGDGGALIRRHQTCIRCSGSGKLDLLTCEGCRGERRVRLAVRSGPASVWTLIDLECRRCAATGLVPAPQTVPAAEAGKAVKCVACAGGGQVRMQKIKDGYGTELKGDCLSCGGKGAVVRAACAACGGTGAREEKVACDAGGTTVTRIVPGACGECGSTGVQTLAP